MAGGPEATLFLGLLLLSTKLCVYAWLQLQCSRAHTVLNHTKHALLCTQLNPRPKPKSAPLFKGALVLLFHPAMFPNVHLLHPAVGKIEESSYIVLENKWPLFWTCLIFMEAPFTPPNALGSPKRWIEYLNRVLSLHNSLVTTQPLKRRIENVLMQFIYAFISLKIIHIYTKSD